MIDAQRVADRLLARPRGCRRGFGAEAPAGCLWRSQAPPPARPASARNGSAGSPGSSASTVAAPAAIASGFGLPPSWRISAASALPSMPPLVTTMPAAVETSSAGICVTSPSPTVSVVKVDDRVGERHAVAHHADRQAAEDIDDGDDQPGDRVAAHELRRAVHGAVEAALLLQVLAAPAGDLLVDQAGGHVGVDRHLLARHGIQAEPRGDLGDAAGPLGDDHEVHHQQDARTRSGRSPRRRPSGSRRTRRRRGRRRAGPRCRATGSAGWSRR